MNINIIMSMVAMYVVEHREHWGQWRHNWAHTLYILRTIGKNRDRDTVRNTLGTGNQVNNREHTEYTLGAPQIMEYRLIRH